MTIDLRPYKGWVSYTKNGQDLGIAFSGLEDWGQIFTSCLAFSSITSG